MYVFIPLTLIVHFTIFYTFFLPFSINASQTASHSLFIIIYIEWLSVASIDILYNNAAIMMPYHDDVWNIPTDEFRKSFETNVISQIRLCNALHVL